MKKKTPTLRKMLIISALLTLAGVSTIDVRANGSGTPSPMATLNQKLEEHPKIAKGIDAVKTYLSNDSDIGTVAQALKKRYLKEQLNSALINAADDETENLNVVKALVEAGADVNTVDKSTIESPPLFFAASNNFVKIIDYLLSKGALVDKKNNYGQTPLMFTAQEGRVEAAKRLLEAGADKNSTNTSGETSLMHAVLSHMDSEHQVKQDNLPVLQLLLDRGANPNKVDEEGSTALHMAIEHGHDSLAQALINSRSIDLDKKDGNGDTPLIFAVRQGNSQIVSDLLNAGADESIQDASGLTAYQLAITVGLNEIAQRISKQSIEPGEYGNVPPAA